MGSTKMGGACKGNRDEAQASQPARPATVRRVGRLPNRHGKLVVKGKVLYESTTGSGKSTSVLFITWNKDGVCSTAGSSPEPSTINALICPSQAPKFLARDDGAHARLRRAPMTLLLTLGRLALRPHTCSI